MNMTDCKNCVHGRMTYILGKDRQTGEQRYVLYKVICCKPSYGKRKFDVRIKTNCPEYEKRQRQETDGQGV